MQRLHSIVIEDFSILIFCTLDLGYTNNNAIYKINSLFPMILEVVSIVDLIYRFCIL